MKSYSLSQLTDSALDRDLDAAFAREHQATADVLAALAESERRQRHIALGYPSLGARRVEAVPQAKAEPMAARRYGLQVMLDQEAHDDLVPCQELLGHGSPAAEIGAVLGRALKALARELEKQKFAATDRPKKPRQTQSPRDIPAHMRRTVAERDGHRCTFVSDSGHRCPARSPIEYDHIVPVARGGQTTVDNLRLRCRAHNQFTAEQAFGQKFMEHKRDIGRPAAMVRKKGSSPSQRPTRLHQSWGPAR